MNSTDQLPKPHVLYDAMPKPPATAMGIGMQIAFQLLESGASPSAVAASFIRPIEPDDVPIDIAFREIFLGPSRAARDLVEKHAPFVEGGTWIAFLAAGALVEKYVRVEA